MKTPKPHFHLYVPCDPYGDLIHTHIATSEKYAIDSMIDEDDIIKSMLPNPGPKMNWEQLKAEGWTVVPCSIIPE